MDSEEEEDLHIHNMVIKSTRTVPFLGNNPHITLFRGTLQRGNRGIFIRRADLANGLRELIFGDIEMTLRLQDNYDIILKILDFGQLNNRMYTGYEFDYSLNQFWSLDSGNKNAKKFIEFSKRLLSGVREAHEEGNIAFNNILPENVVIRNELGDLIPKICDLSMVTQVENNLNRVRDLNMLGKLFVTLLMEDESDQTLERLRLIELHHLKLDYMRTEITRKNEWINRENAFCLSEMINSLIDATVYDSEIIDRIMELPFEY